MEKTAQLAESLADKSWTISETEVEVGPIQEMLLFYQQEEKAEQGDKEKQGDKVEQGECVT